MSSLRTSPAQSKMWGKDWRWTKLTRGGCRGTGCSRSSQIRYWTQIWERWLLALSPTNFRTLRRTVVSSKRHWMWIIIIPGSKWKMVNSWTTITSTWTQIFNLNQTSRWIKTRRAINSSQELWLNPKFRVKQVVRAQCWSRQGWSLIRHLSKTIKCIC